KVADVSLALAASSTQNLAALSIAAVPGQTYAIERSAAINYPINWVSVTNLTLTGPTNWWYDPQPATIPQRFYRVGAIPATAQSRPLPWETADIGAMWTDDFNRASLGANWIVLGGANVSILGDELVFDQS